MVSESVWVIRTVPSVVDPRPSDVSVKVKVFADALKVTENDGVSVVGMA